MDVDLDQGAMIASQFAQDRAHLVASIRPSALAPGYMKEGEKIFRIERTETR